SHSQLGDFLNRPVAVCFRFLFQSSKKFPSREVWAAAQPFALAFCMDSTGSVAIRSTDWRCSSYALTWKVILITLHRQPSAVLQWWRRTGLTGSRSAASLPFNTLQFGRSCVSFYSFRSLKFELRRHESSSHPEFRMPQRLRIVQTRVQLLRPSLQ